VYDEGEFPDEVCTFCNTVGCIALFCRNSDGFWHEGSCLVLFFIGNFLCEWYVILRSKDCSEYDCTGKLLWVGIGFMAVTMAATVRVGIIWGCTV